METKPLRYFSNSRVETDEQCPRKGFLNKEWGGTGIVPIYSGWDLEFGNLMHKYLYQLAKSNAIKFKDAREELLAEGMKQLNQVQAEAYAASGEGLLRGFAKTVWPQWMKEYDVFSAEGVVEFEPYEGFRYRAIKDLILKNKYDKSLSYREYKSCSSTDAKWIASWSRHPQIHCSMYATQKAEKIEIRDCVVVGLYKGYKDKKLGLKRNVMNYGYVNREFPMSPEYSYKYTARKGWEMFPTYHEFDDMGEWVAGMPQDQLTELYPQTGPIFLREDIAESWFRQQRYRQWSIQDSIEGLSKCKEESDVDYIMDKTFPKRMTQCTPQYGDACPYLPICETEWIAEDPIGSGQFEVNKGMQEKEEEA